jgi:AraC family transcriptional regulator of adaptative response / DNA-3-methyladenine glycosylase II
MNLERKSFYRALLARDARFDGLFFVGVTSTGIYCRPVCPVKPPREANCCFYQSPQEAEQAGYRPCLRCRPELAPGNAPMDHSQRLAKQIVERIEEGSDEKRAVEVIAAEFALSARQIRRIIRKELGVAPIQLLLTRRLLLAKQLLTETKLAVTQIAFASGFSSLRRFNDAFATRYRMPPSRLRKQAALEDSESIDSGGVSSLLLCYRPPYDWEGMLDFLKARELRGVEWVTKELYARTVQLGKCRGWIRVKQAGARNALLLEFSHGLTPVLPGLIRRVRHLFDLDARPELISEHLGKDRRLRPLVKRNPGLRVPGAFNGFELGWRAVLGQQITVRAATTIAARFVERLGEPIQTGFSELNRLTPAAERVVRTDGGQLAELGIIRARAQCILAIAQSQSSPELSLGHGHHPKPEAMIERLVELPGIGRWTAQYIAMRALRWPDAFPKEDIAVRKKLGGITSKQAEQLSERWRPWRSYAVLHLWHAPEGSLPDGLTRAASAKSLNRRRPRHSSLQNDGKELKDQG